MKRIGELFAAEDGNKYRVVECLSSELCEGCVAEDDDNLCLQLPQCMSRFRGDQKNVHFEEEE